MVVVSFEPVIFMVAAAFTYLGLVVALADLQQLFPIISY